MNRVLLSGVLLSVSFALPVEASGGRGMTWLKRSHSSTYGVDHVGCDNGVICNAYSGDTACTTALPVLCIKRDGSPTPSGLATDYYNGWVGGHIATTPPVQGITLTSPTVADQICAANLGVGWRMAEFHDGGGGWNWYAYGNVRDDMRFWVHINNQPANCWNP
ncbi:flagellar hook-length control protein [Cystobacter fuscus]|uniref:flagellar hook-length control protein n=1 Tax=Cystobacter fuscus TaxID=43 RepID=UPI002B2D3C9F|nr:flagellar hook-length control protein [Cystobacter fuscus]